MTEKKEKLILMCTHGPEDPERATIPFVMATTAQASDMDVVIGLQVDGVLLARKGVAETIAAPAFPPLKELMDIYLENGGKIFGLRALRKITPNKSGDRFYRTGANCCKCSNICQRSERSDKRTRLLGE